MEQLKSEILFWLQRNGKEGKFQLWMTSISDVQGQGLWGEDVWSLKRSVKANLATKVVVRDGGATSKNGA